MPVQTSIIPGIHAEIMLKDLVQALLPFGRKVGENFVYLGDNSSKKRGCYQENYDTVDLCKFNSIKD